MRVWVAPGGSTSLWRWPFVNSFQADDIYSGSIIKKWTWRLMVKGRQTHHKGRGADLKPGDGGGGRQDLLGWKTRSIFCIFTSALKTKLHGHRSHVGDEHGRVRQYERTFVQHYFLQTISVRKWKIIIFQKKTEIGRRTMELQEWNTGEAGERDISC